MTSSGRPRRTRRRRRAPRRAGALKTVVYVDYNNVKSRAVKAKWSSHGHFSPWELANLICTRRNNKMKKAPTFRPFELVGVCVYVGHPDPDLDLDPHAFDREKRRFAAWREDSDHRLRIVAPFLQYPCTWHAFKRERDDVVEKEVDTSLAVDMVSMAVEGKFDVAILFSSDTDYRPPVYDITERSGAREFPRVDLAAWSPRGILACPEYPELEDSARHHILHGHGYMTVADDENYEPPTAFGAALEAALKDGAADRAQERP